MLTWCGYALGAAALVYGIIACLAVRMQLRAARAAAGAARRDMPAATVLKPLCGAETETYDCLRSFCDQEYPTFQVIFGVADPNDPVIAIARRLQREFPQRDLRLVIDGRQHGSSRKVSNLVNMMAYANHDYIVLSDSDVRVRSDYLAKVVAPLLESDVGIVTCPYRGVSRGGLWSRLESMFINEWFMPSVRVAAAAGSRAFAFGASIALRRDVLSQIGGFVSIVDQLADDYRLGELTRGRGLRTVLSDVVVEIAVAQRSFQELIGHELRWLRTIRMLRPAGYSFSFVTFTIPVALIAACLSRGAPAALIMLAIAALARFLLHLQTRQAGATAAQLFIVPFRDMLSLSLWAVSFRNRRVRWRDDHFEVTPDGSVELVVRGTP
ncbi:MAG TPA: bacteriohopanetetrol glucosamine biosynthesis glycosyltransferase HpnI [Steroidobacteraceae bacterium]|jgi:ceramide glucosyltransferase|nr:bacteriohopanetetrol glucosamine biosynthesis glycosyltransferase HpnI [Steroidobacteraceae bacterium]